MQQGQMQQMQQGQMQQMQQGQMQQMQQGQMQQMRQSARPSFPLNARLPLGPNAMAGPPRMGMPTGGMSAGGMPRPGGMAMSAAGMQQAGMQQAQMGGMARPLAGMMQGQASMQMQGQARPSGLPQGQAQGRSLAGWQQPMMGAQPRQPMQMQMPQSGALVSGMASGTAGMGGMGGAQLPAQALGSDSFLSSAQLSGLAPSLATSLAAPSLAPKPTRVTLGLPKSKQTLDGYLCYDLASRHAYVQPPFRMNIFSMPGLEVTNDGQVWVAVHDPEGKDRPKGPWGPEPICIGSLDEEGFVVGDTQAVAEALRLALDGTAPAPGDGLTGSTLRERLRQALGGIDVNAFALAFLDSEAADISATADEASESQTAGWGLGKGKGKGTDVGAGAAESKAAPPPVDPNAVPSLEVQYPAVQAYFLPPDGRAVAVGGKDQPPLNYFTRGIPPVPPPLPPADTTNTSAGSLKPDHRAADASPLGVFAWSHLSGAAAATTDGAADRTSLRARLESSASLGGPSMSLSLTSASDSSGMVDRSAFSDAVVAAGATPGGPSNSNGSGQLIRTAGGRTRLGHNAALTLKLWFARHWTNPFPTEAERTKLLEVTGLTATQLTDWFRSERMRFNPSPQAIASLEQSLKNRKGKDRELASANSRKRTRAAIQTPAPVPEPSDALTKLQALRKPKPFVVPRGSGGLLAPRTFLMSNGIPLEVPDESIITADGKVLLPATALPPSTRPMAPFVHVPVAVIEGSAADGATREKRRVRKLERQAAELEREQRAAAHHNVPVTPHALASLLPSSVGTAASVASQGLLLPGSAVESGMKTEPGSRGAHPDSSMPSVLVSPGDPSVAQALSFLPPQSSLLFDDGHSHAGSNGQLHLLSAPTSRRPTAFSMSEFAPSMGARTHETSSATAAAIDVAAERRRLNSTASVLTAAIASQPSNGLASGDSHASSSSNAADPGSLSSLPPHIQTSILSLYSASVGSSAANGTSGGSGGTGPMPSASFLPSLPPSVELVRSDGTVSGTAEFAILPASTCLLLASVIRTRGDPNDVSYMPIASLTDDALSILTDSTGAIASSLLGALTADGTAGGSPRPDQRGQSTNGSHGVSFPVLIPEHHLPLPGSGRRGMSFRFLSTDEGSGGMAETGMHLPMQMQADDEGDHDGNDADSAAGSSPRARMHSLSHNTSALSAHTHVFSHTSPAQRSQAAPGTVASSVGRKHVRSRDGSISFPFEMSVPSGASHNDAALGAGPIDMVGSMAGAEGLHPIQHDDPTGDEAAAPADAVRGTVGRPHFQSMDWA
jgi:hypothetical protein